MNVNAGVAEFSVNETPLGEIDPLMSAAFAESTETAAMEASAIAVAAKIVEIFLVRIMLVFLR